MGQNILIIDIDSKITNIALKKIELYHKRRGDHVLWDPPLWSKGWADRVYVSCIFTENKDQCLDWEEFAEIGGSGYDLTVELPQKIEAVRPHISLGFTSRGCPRNCPFCVVPRKEGKFRIVGDLLDLWNGDTRSILTVLDNNILADTDHFKKICGQARDNFIRVDFNQGLDFRFLTMDVVKELKTIRHKEFRFAFDDPGDLQRVGNAIDLLQNNGLRSSIWYILVGFNTIFKEDLMRLNYLRKRGQTAFVMRYKKTLGNRLVAQWANQHALFKAVTFGKFLEIPRYKKFVQKYRDEVDSYFEGE